MLSAEIYTTMLILWLIQARDKALFSFHFQLKFYGVFYAPNF